MSHHDVIIIGAGFTGLSAARELTAGGVDVLILEANGRVGGRVESQLNGLGERIDTGGQFLCEDMPELMALVRAFDLPLLEPHFEGRTVTQPATTPADFAAAYQGSEALRERLGAIDLDDRNATDLTVAEWVERQAATPSAKAAFRSMVQGLWCLPMEDIPVWHLADNDRRITNETFELQYHVGGTLHALADRLATDLGDRLRLSQPVTRITTGEGGLAVEAGGNTYLARNVIVALPPCATGKIDFHPALPAKLSRALSPWRSGTVIKALVRYERPFWRDDGRSGVVMWRDHPGLFACDTGIDGRAALTVFAGGPLALDLRKQGEAGIRAEIMARLAAALGDQAGAPLDIHIRDWSFDQWSGGGYSDLIVDMTARDTEALITAGHPPIHFACSEISPSFPGYVEGAIMAGRLAAERILSLKVGGA